MRVETVLLVFYIYSSIYSHLHQFSLFSTLFLQHCHFAVFYLCWSYNFLINIFCNQLHVVLIGFYSDGLQYALCWMFLGPAIWIDDFANLGIFQWVLSTSWSQLVTIGHNMFSSDQCKTSNVCYSSFPILVPFVNGSKELNTNSGKKYSELQSKQLTWMCERLFIKGVNIGKHK